MFTGDNWRINITFTTRTAIFLLTFGDIVSGRSFTFLRECNPHSGVYVHATFDDLDINPRSRGCCHIFVQKKKKAGLSHFFICTHFRESTNSRSAWSPCTSVTVHITSVLGQPHWLPADARISWICMVLFQLCYLHLHSLWSPAAVFSFLIILPWCRRLSPATPTL